MRPPPPRDPARRAVVTGLGAITPVGNDVATFWRNLTDGVSGVAPITLFDASDYEVQIAAEVKLENLIKRGRLSDARLAAEQARYRTVQYAEALRRNIYPEGVSPQALAALARYAMALRDGLAAQSPARIASGELHFPEAPA